MTVASCQAESTLQKMVLSLMENIRSIIKKCSFRILIVGLYCLSNAVQADEFIIVQSTTSTQNSGLYDFLLPPYQEKTNVSIRVVAVGTGQALKNAENCDGDILLVHAKSDEEKFVASGFGLVRRDVMYNDFVLLGPQHDPAGISGAASIETALERIAQNQSRFVSRGDDSGTHKAERGYWNLTGINPETAAGSWYLETGQGMGATLNLAVQLDGYVLTDRATWLAFGNQQEHRILFEGDSKLFNQYGIIVINPAHCPKVKKDLAQDFSDWLVSHDGQQLINQYRVGNEQLFFANAK